MKSKILTISEKSILMFTISPYQRCSCGKWSVRNAIITAYHVINSCFVVKSVIYVFASSIQCLFVFFELCCVWMRSTCRKSGGKDV